MSEQPLTREDVARLELGTTAISPRLAWVMVIVFLVTLTLPPALQLAWSFGQARAVEHGRIAALASATASHAASLLPGLPSVDRARSLAGWLSRVPTARELRAFEDRLNEDSLVTRALGPWVGWVIKGALHGGDEQVCFGRDGWLFYRPSVESVTGPGFLTARWQHDRLRNADASAPLPQPDPLKALLQFHQQLAVRGIALVVVPTPGKESVQPEKLAPGWDGRREVVENVSFASFKEDLGRAGVKVFDPAPMLAGLKQRGGRDVYLKSDTHWTAPAMEEVAAQLAVWLRERQLTAGPGTETWRQQRQVVRHTGDIAAMLRLPKHQSFFPQETVEIGRVVTGAGQPWGPDESAPVLLLGDSFSNIYSLGEMGWGEGAGFAEHLSAALGQPLDRLVINAGGAFSARQELARQLASGRDRLAGKRVVIYQFAARELAMGDWKLINLAAAPAAKREAAVPMGASLGVEGRVAAIARLPQPGSVPYKDCLIALHLTGLRGAAARAVPAEALVYAFGMRENRWLPVASLKAGDAVRCRLIDWAQVERRYGAFNRAELDDLGLLALPTLWAEAVGRGEP
jgi:alginate O-acetyltransferase complex protein AlgJ